MFGRDNDNSSKDLALTTASLAAAFSRLARRLGDEVSIHAINRRLIIGPQCLIESFENLVRGQEQLGMLGAEVAGNPPRVLRLVKLALAENDGKGVELVALTGQGTHHTARVDAAGQEYGHRHVGNHPQGRGLQEYGPHFFECRFAPWCRSGAERGTPVAAALGSQAPVRLAKGELPAFPGKQAVDTPKHRPGSRPPPIGQKAPEPARMQLP